MQTIILDCPGSVPENFTGIAEFPDGTKAWFKEGKSHREDGPACEYPDGTKHWYKEGKLHREDGPAVEYANGNKYWYLENKMIVSYSVRILTESIILDVLEHPIYPLVKMVKFLDKDSVFEFCIMPGMRLYSKI